VPTQAPALGADLFTASARRVIDYLNTHTPLDAWSVTRVTGGEQVQVHVQGDDIVERGQRVAWSDTFCVHMVNGAAPIVADTQAESDYADHPHARSIRAYAGVPLTDDDGELFGVLCGFGTEPLASPAEIDGDLVNLMGGLLSTHLVAARTADRGRRATEIAEALAHTDPLTGLTNRRGWDSLVADAQQRVDAYGDLVAVAVIDLDGLKTVNDTHGHAAGDELIVRAAQALARAAGPGDRVARYGGDEFVVLANSVPVADLEQHFAAFTDALSAVGVSASLGHATTSPGKMSVLDAFTAADRSMYARKPPRSDPAGASS
jgi:diguanylate cyclase (GGDEF)-like protein